MKEIINEFKAFAMKSNVIETAVAFIMALAFKPIIDTTVNGIFMPLIARIAGKPNFHSLTIDLGKGAVITYGSLLTVIIEFLFVAVALFIVIKVYKKTQKEKPAEAAKPTKDQELLTEIRDLLKK
ncbi:MAG: large conductance mechanosensitive channel protein MscL [Crocinitomicaceae bacterium]|nr:large conductance mechanosensitive channel protein MscL [Crocinitomicaceae bacterium]